MPGVRRSGVPTPGAVSRPPEGTARRAHICAPQGKWVSLDPGASRDLTLSGAGVLRRLWCVFNPLGRPPEAMRTLTRHPEFYRNIWLHIAFDDVGDVHVSAPVADFFLLGHGEIDDLDSRWFQSVRIPPLAEPPFQGALTCLAPMPFAECARLSFVNRNPIPIRVIASVDWLETAPPATPPRYFHATYAHGRRTPLVLLDRREHEGTFVGLGLSVHNEDPAARWHEDPERFELDGKRLIGTGAEDYFCLAWGFRRQLSRPLFGVTCARPQGGASSLPSGTFNPAGTFAMYRLHDGDPLPFTRSVRLSFANRCRVTAPFAFRAVSYWYGRRRT